MLIAASQIAIEGCAHGELDKIYATLEYIERTENVKIDLLLVCGDFQSLRNVADLDVLACPAKYRTMGTFYQYYSGQKKAPYPTIFVGGNHEASNYLWELFHGGWVCPNIYFLGFAGVIKFGGLRIGGLTGIYKDQDYEKGYFEQQPYDDSASRSIYHVRKFNVYRLLQLAHSDRLDVFLSHDWPRGIAYHGNHKALLSSKPFLREEVNTNTLGSMPAELLLQNLKPRYWFAAHLHVKFAALVKHDAGQSNSEVHVGSAAQANAESGDVSRDAGVPADAMAAVHDALEAEVAHTIGGDTLESLPAATTRFLALDKCVPNRDFLQIIDVPEGDASKGFAYDPYWLAVVRATNDFLSFSVSQIPLPENEEAQG
ncbi:Metallo-dependent phosphatase-like protein [Hyaloraphidium curvatum]|nr:Metallo-dependent phosphatase-like protein [Hyaloraphidium curvatum]